METIPLVDDDSGIGIGPGVVVVDVSSASALTVADMREAFAEADAQQRDAALSPGDLLGDLDISPL